MNDSGSGVTRQAEATHRFWAASARSGPKHDLTGWLVDIPPRFALFQDTSHGFTSPTFSDGKKRSKHILEKEWLWLTVCSGFFRLSLVILQNNNNNNKNLKKTNTLSLLTNTSQPDNVLKFSMIQYRTRRRPNSGSCIMIHDIRWVYFVHIKPAGALCRPQRTPYARL